MNVTKVTNDKYYNKQGFEFDFHELEFEFEENENFHKAVMTQTYYEDGGESIVINDLEKALKIYDNWKNEINLDYSTNLLLMIETEKDGNIKVETIKMLTFNH